MLNVEYTPPISATQAFSEKTTDLAGLDHYFAEPESSVRLPIEQISLMALTLVSIRNSQPIHGDKFAYTAARTEIGKST
jgi:hypothetical protein